MNLLRAFLILTLSISASSSAQPSKPQTRRFNDDISLCLPKLHDPIRELRLAYPGIRVMCHKGGGGLDLAGPPDSSVFQDPAAFVLANLHLFLSSATRESVEFTGLQQTFGGIPIFERGIHLHREVLLNSPENLEIPGIPGTPLRTTNPKPQSAATVSVLAVALVDTSMWKLATRVEVPCDQAIELSKRHLESKEPAREGMRYHCNPSPHIMVDYCFQGPALITRVHARGAPLDRTFYINAQTGFFCPNQ